MYGEVGGRYARRIKYDDADFHSDGDFPEGLPDEAGGTHIGMFLAWALLSGLGGKLHMEECAEGVVGLRKRTLTPGEYLFTYCDGELTDQELGEEGNAFAIAYYKHKDFRYYADYEQAVGSAVSSLYEVPDGWATYDKLSPMLDRRLSEWRSRPRIERPRLSRRPWWRFW